MTCICKYNQGKDVKDNRLKGETDNSIYDLTLNKEYDIFGISIYDNVLLYLVSDDSELPNWYSANCFEIINNQIKEGWCFREFISKKSLLKMLLGYKLLVEDEKHYLGLLEREKEHIEYFSKTVVLGRC